VHPCRKGSQSGLIDDDEISRRLQEALIMSKAEHTDIWHAIHTPSPHAGEGRKKPICNEDENTVLCLTKRRKRHVNDNDAVNATCGQCQTRRTSSETLLPSPAVDRVHSTPSMTNPPSNLRFLASRSPPMHETNRSCDGSSSLSRPCPAHVAQVLHSTEVPVRRCVAEKRPVAGDTPSRVESEREILPFSGERKD
jgi:hypothetical protein